MSKAHVPPKDSTDSSQKIPSPEELKAITSATKRFVRTVQQSFLVAGQTDPPGYPTGPRILQVINAITDLERTLNPRKIPFGRKGRMAILVGNWPNATNLIDSLEWLQNLHNDIIKSWQLEAICEGKGSAIPTTQDGHATQFGEGTIGFIFERGWPPKIEATVLKSMLIAATLIESIVSSVEKPKLVRGDTQDQRNTTGAGTGQQDNEDHMSKEARALAVLMKNPEYTNNQIANIAGVHPKSLSRMPRFKQARDILKADKHKIPRGSKNGKTGDIEAWEQNEP